MDIYTLDGGLERAEIIEPYKSVIWTERYTKPGDVQLSVKDSPGMRELLAEGVLLSTPETDEAMMIHTQEIEDGILTVSGPSLLQILADRIFRFFYDGTIQAWSWFGVKPGQVIYDIVNYMVVNGGAGLVYDTGLDLAHEMIPNLDFGYIDVTGTTYPAITVDFDSVLNAITTVADREKMGLKIYLDPNVDGQMLFTTYRGVVRTSESPGTPLVRFSPVMDNLTNVKELHSIAEYKNVAYSFRTNWLDPDVRALKIAYLDPDAPTVFITNQPGVAYAPGFSAATVGLSRRTLMVEVNDLSTEELTQLNQAQHDYIMYLRAANELANYNYTRLVEGEVTPQSGYVFNQDYYMGDFVELQGLGGALQAARVTEYIRIKDETGRREYPTVSVE